MVIWQLFLFPVLSLFLGLSPAHEQICCELGKSSILVPISAIIAEAAVTSIPGIEHNKASASESVAISLSIDASITFL